MPTQVAHGCYGRESKFEIIQHDYAASGAAVYIECLEVIDGPEDKPKYIIHWYYVQNTDFPGDHSWYFESLDDAVRAWKDFWPECRLDPQIRFLEAEGYINYEHHGLESPWYYATD